MKRLFIKLLLIILTLNFILGSIAVNAADETNLTEQQKAIINVANSYYSKGAGIQYDQKRRFLDIKPEDAKDKWPIYLDCSSFVYNVYRQTFGVELQAASSESKKLINTLRLINEAKEECKTQNRNKIRTTGTENDYIACYVDDLNKIRENNTLKNLKQLLKPGDLIVYRELKGKYQQITNYEHGHVLLYLGNGEIIHCTGQRYDYDESVEHIETAGIKKTTLNSLITSGKSMYLLKNDEEKGDIMKRFAVLRPLNAPYIKNTELTEYAKLKNEIPKLNIQLNSSIGNLKTVNLGSSITYTLYLQNNDTEKAKDIIINEKVSKYLTIDKNSIVTTVITTRDDGVKQEKDIDKTIKIDENNNLSCTINTINPGSTIRIKYKAVVTKDARNLGKIIESQIKVGKEINSQKLFENTNKIVHTIGRTLKVSEKDKIITVAEQYISKSEYSGKTRNLIDDIYKDALGVDCGFSSLTTENMFDNIMRENNRKVELISNNTKTRKILLENMYGYNLQKYNDATTGVRNLNTNNLLTGDAIIYTYKYGTTNKYGIYFYIAEDKLIGVSNNKVIVKKDVQRELDKLIGKDKFAVLRPSLDM